MYDIEKLLGIPAELLEIIINRVEHVWYRKVNGNSYGVAGYKYITSTLHQIFLMMCKWVSLLYYITRGNHDSIVAAELSCHSKTRF